MYMPKLPADDNTRWTAIRVAALVTDTMPRVTFRNLDVEFQDEWEPMSKDDDEHGPGKRRVAHVRCEITSGQRFTKIVTLCKYQDGHTYGRMQ